MINVGNEPNIVQLRDELERITTEIIGARVGEQIRLIEELRPRFDHSITITSSAVPTDRDTFAYNCFQYALNLVQPPKLVAEIATLYPHVYPNSQFIQYLAAN